MKLKTMFLGLLVLAGGAAAADVSYRTSSERDLRQ